MPIGIEMSRMTNASKVYPDINFYVRILINFNFFLSDAPVIMEVPNPIFIKSMNSARSQRDFLRPGGLSFIPWP